MKTAIQLSLTRLSVTILTAMVTVGTFCSTRASAQSGYYASAYRSAPAAVQRIAYPYGYPPAAYGYRPAAQPVAYAQPRQVAYAYPQTRQVARAYPQQARPMPVVRAMPAPQAAVGGNYLSFNGKYASAPSHLPAPVRAAVAAGNNIQDKPYTRGGGHSRVDDSSYDCSGSASYLLIKAGLLNRPLSSKEFANYGEAGPGRFITIYVKAGEHVFMSVCGLRLDTTGGYESQGPRWRATARSMNGFTMRHPFGL